MVTTYRWWFTRRLIATALLALVFFGGCRAAATGPVEVVAGCPPVLTGRTSDGGYTDWFVWGGRRYREAAGLTPAPALPQRIVLGPRVGSITCNLVQLTEGQDWEVADGPMPDGVATVLAVGTPLFKIAGADRQCSLAVRSSSGPRVYVAVDTSQPSEPLLC